MVTGTTQIDSELPAADEVVSKDCNGKIPVLVARTGRHRQRYEDGFRLVAGCIPYKYSNNQDGSTEKVLKVLMITPHRGEGFLFPKGGWETDETVEEAACREAIEEAGVRGNLQEFLGCWDFKSKRQQNDYSPEGHCRAHMFALAVSEQLDSWPEQHARQRQWFSIAEALDRCDRDWMLGALNKCLTYLSTLQEITTSQDDMQETVTNSNFPPS